MAWPNVYGLDVSQFDRSGATRPSKPTILLIHDAFHTSAHMELLAQQLRLAEFRVLAPQLPSASPYLVPSSLDADMRTLVDCGRIEIDQGRDIVVVAHGYGSIPGCMAADHLDQYSMDRPGTGQIRRLLIIAGVILMPDQSFSDVHAPAWITRRQAGLLSVGQATTVFFQDLAPEMTAWAVSLLQPQNEDSLRTRIRAPGWSGLPLLYVRCENDNAVPPSLQAEFVELLGRYNRQAAAVSLQSGHSPFLSAVQEVLQLIIRAAA